jgi:asparagine synthetase B (glutamine-hydrolysing)
LTNFSEFDTTGTVKYYQILLYDTLDDPSEIKYYSPDNTYAGSLYYTYDNNPNAFAGYNKKLGTIHPYNKHNIKSITSSQTPVNGVVTFILGTTTIKVTLYSSTFEYDVNNLPTKEVRTYQSGTPGTFVYEYK